MRNPRRRSAILAALGLGLVLAGSTAEAGRAVRAGLHDARPVAFRDEAGVARGFAVEVLNAIAANEDWDLEYVYGTWAECEARLESGEIDLLFPILPTGERDKIYDFTSQVMFSTWGRVFAARGIEVESILDLDGRIVAVVQGDYFGRELRDLVERFGLAPSFLELDTKTAVLESLASGSADAAALEGKAGYALVMEYDIEATPIVYTPTSPRLAVPEGRHADLLEALDRQLTEMKADRSSIYYSAYDAWFGVPRTRDWPRWLTPTLGAAGGLLVLFAGFSLILRAQVRSRTRQLEVQNEQLRREIAERLRAEEKLRQAQKMEAVGTLAAGVAHEFNNLLMVISAHATLLRGRVSGGGEVSDSLSIMEDAVRQATGFTRSLLTFSHKLPVNKTPTDLCAAVNSAARMLRRTLPASIDLEVDTRCEPCPWINADEGQLQQIVFNLAVNARDAMPRGGSLQVSVEPTGNGDPGRETARLTVRDSGSGMSPDVRARIFEPFFTTKSRGRGTGLGLAFVHGLVEEYGGRIEVRSEEGAGSTFTIEWPTVPPAERRAREDTRLPAATGQGELILLAEDQQQIREVLAAFLTSQGYVVEQVDNGDEVVERFERYRGRLRLLVLDVDLPRRSGLDALRAIRTAGGEVPAIIMSGSVGEFPEDLDLRAVLLPKPFQLRALGELIRQRLQALDEAGDP